MWQQLVILTLQEGRSFPRPFLLPCPHDLLPMPTLFDPLAYLATLGAYAKVSIEADGELYITLEFMRGISSKAQLKPRPSQAFRPLLLIQLRPRGHNAAHI